jgi:two-component system, OmpR family, copper resistance phosphate regulon response regulator CusR
MKVLLIEDEIRVSRFIKKGLEEQTYDVDVAYDGQTGIRLAKSNQYDLIILDVVLPKQNGFDICNTIRKENKIIPILMLTALSSLNDKVMGLDSGADDYLTKPFHFQELLARIRALKRRSNTEGIYSRTIQVDDLIIDLESKEVRRLNKIISLTAREFRFLVLLAENKGKVLSRALIAEKIWEQSFDSGSNVIDVYVNYLRKKIDHDHEKKLIHTIIGMGYIMKD